MLISLAQPLSFLYDEFSPKINLGITRDYTTGVYADILMLFLVLFLLITAMAEITSGSTF